MTKEGLKPCIAETDIWMQQNGKQYEYVAVYVDDLAFAMKEPKKCVDVLENKYKCKLKGTGILKYHLGENFKRDKH